MSNIIVVFQSSAEMHSANFLPYLFCIFPHFTFTEKLHGKIINVQMKNEDISIIVVRSYNSLNGGFHEITGTVPLILILSTKLPSILTYFIHGNGLRVG